MKLFLDGKSYRAIAKEMKCSVGLVHKILNEQPKGIDNNPSQPKQL